MIVFRPYKIGYETAILEQSSLFKTIKTYYPINRVRIISEHVYDNKPYHYIVRVAGTTDEYEVSHWDLDFSKDLIESRTFTLAENVCPGVVVKSLDDGELYMMKEGRKTTNGLELDGMVEIMVQPDMLILVESMMR